MGHWIGNLGGRRVNLLLEGFLIAAVGTGLVSWGVGTGWARWWTVAHALAGLSVLVVSPVKLRGPVRAGFRRGRASRWLSSLFGVLVLATIGLGLAHATGLWFGVGYWSALWTHVLVGFTLVPLLVWHVVSRPVTPRRTDLDRRMLLGGAAAVGVAGAAYGLQAVATQVGGAAGADRRATGSHEIASFRPAGMPTVSWLDDEAPDTPVAEWVLTVGDRPIDLATLRADVEPVEAVLDCTGGWRSRQRWDAVALDRLVDLGGAASVRVTSATGYQRILPARDADHLHLAVGYGGEPLRRGHGGPVRLIAPGRRGFWWVKWVTDVSPDDRLWWWQLPFPPT